MSWKFFRGSVTDQAEKSARASQSLALKGRDPLWICVAEGALADTLGVMGKREGSEEARKEGREMAGRLPVVMQVEEDEEIKDDEIKEEEVDVERWCGDGIGGAGVSVSVSDGRNEQLNLNGMMM